MARKERLEEHLFQALHGRDDAHLSSRVQAMHFHLARDQVRRHLCICGCACAAAVHVICEIMDLGTILVRNDGTLGRACICAQNNAVAVQDADDRGSCRRRFWRRHALRFQEAIPIVSWSDANDVEMKQSMLGCASFAFPFIKLIFKRKRK